MKLGRAMDEYNLVPKMMNPKMNEEDTSLHGRFQCKT